MRSPHTRAMWAALESRPEIAASELVDIGAAMVSPFNAIDRWRRSYITKRGMDPDAAANPVPKEARIVSGSRIVARDAIYGWRKQRLVEIVDGVVKRAQ